MKVVINGKTTELPEGATVADAVSHAGAGVSGVATALNGEVVTRRVWGETPLGEGDRVEVLTAVQGG